MQGKKEFSKYIAEKRKKIGLTQEQLAERLYVIPTTISKWERGVSYPDITMIPNLCKELNISEHEFFTACDDEATNKIKKEHNKFNMLKKVSYYTLTIGYVIGILTCFICNLLIDRTLSWSLIVCVGIGISFTITNLPIYMKNIKYKWIIITVIFSLLIYLLLLTICYITNGNWLLGSLILASTVLLFVWIDVLICTLTNISTKNKVSISLVLFATATMISNPLANNYLNISNNESNLPNIICSILMIIIATLIGFSKRKES